jgi:hypothetical protein
MTANRARNRAHRPTAEPSGFKVETGLEAAGSGSGVRALSVAGGARPEHPTGTRRFTGGIMNRLLAIGPGLGEQTS